MTLREVLQIFCCGCNSARLRPRLKAKLKDDEALDEASTSHSDLPVDDAEAISRETLFSVNEVQALYEAFKKIISGVEADHDLSINRGISKEEFRMALFKTKSGKKSFIADHIFNLFDVNHHGSLEFGNFVRSISILHTNAARDDKIDFCFRLYDLQQQGYIEHTDLEHILVAVLESESRILDLSDEAIKQNIRKTFEDVDTNHDGKIDRDEWRRMVQEHPSVLKIVTVSELKQITTIYPSFIFHSQLKDM